MKFIYYILQYDIILQITVAEVDSAKKATYTKYLRLGKKNIYIENFGRKLNSRLFFRKEIFIA